MQASLSTEAESADPVQVLIDTMDADHAASVESRIQALENQNGEMSRKLDQLLLLATGNSQNQNPPGPRPITPPPVHRSPSPSSLKMPKASPPSDYNGDRAQGRSFLNSCRLYMSLRRQEFLDDDASIRWVLSYMKSGRAATFANRVLRNESNGLLPYFTYAEFETAFIREFLPENEALQATLKIESTAYFQGTRDVDSYIDEFKDLVDVSGYTDASRQAHTSHSCLQC